MSDTEWLAEMALPKRAVAGGAPAFDFWSYFDDIPVEDFEAFDCSDGVVSNAYRALDGSCEHVLVRAATPNVFMVLVLDLRERIVRGHRLLNLNEHYGQPSQDA